MLIREANLFDAKNIVELWVELIEEVKLSNCLTNDFEKEKFYLYILKMILDKKFVWIVEDGGIPVGFITAFMTENKTAFVNNIYLKKEHRQPELFFKFIKYAENKAKKDGAQYIEIETIYNNRFSKLAERLGFKPERVKVVKCLG